MVGTLKKQAETSAQPITTTIHKIFREKSLETLQLNINRQDISIQEIPNPDDFLYGQLMGYILIHNSSIKACLKIHYSQSLAESLAAQQLGISCDNVDLETANDFMREYCNLAAGYIADVFAFNNIISNISIPLITDGFDEVWFSDNIRPSDLSDYWQLKWADNKIIVSTVIELKDAQGLANFKLPANNRKSAEEGITFL